jgi:hypothetical protein
MTTITLFSWSKLNHTGLVFTYKEVFSVGILLIKVVTHHYHKKLSHDRFRYSGANTRCLEEPGNAPKKKKQVHLQNSRATQEMNQ